MQEPKRFPIPFLSDPEVMGGTPVFVGTRVPIKNLFDNLGAGLSCDDFLEEFPSVKREQVMQALDMADEALALQSKHETAA